MVKTDPPTAIDFVSHKELGKPRPDGCSEELWSGVSCQSTEQQAWKSTRLPGFGQFIAVLEISPESTIRYQRTGRKQGHHTLWGAPEDLLAAVIEVISP